jgi:folate-binding protein YgfZ
VTTVRELWQSLLPEAVTVGRSAPWAAPIALDHLGDPNGERVALLRGETLLLPRLAHGHLRLTGADRVPFLQGLVSQDVAGLAADGAVDALLLDHRGQPQAGLGVVRRERDLYLVAEDGSGEAVAERLAAQIIFDDVTLERLDERLVSLTLFGAPRGLGEALEAAFPGAGLAYDALDGEVGVRAATAGTPTPHGRMMLRPRRYGPLGAVDLHLLAEDLTPAWSVWSGLGLRPIGERALTAARVAFDIASPFAEGRLGLPQETGLEERVHYRKGCYVGQEIMARVEARGRLRRGLQRLRLAAAPPGLGVAAGWLLVAGEEQVGAVVSAAPAPDGDGWWAIGVVRHDAATAGAVEPWPWQLRVDGPPPRAGAVQVPAGLRAGPQG